AGLAYLQALLTVEGAEEEMRRLLEGAQAAIDREAAQARLWYQRAMKAERDAASLDRQLQEARESTGGITDAVDLYALPAPAAPALPADIRACIQSMRERGDLSAVRGLERLGMDTPAKAWGRLDDAGKIAVALATGARNALPIQMRAYGDMQLWAMLPASLRRAVMDDIDLFCGASP
ncbi:hypothetical protein, partial [Niveispirillum sp. SYP-B3756]|uniref:hypothetical protein n=1 Tax=Niveispirillum sp. SYP-B3756 TaxID=2662178 RepID=UPI0015678056